jgi:hypothetical protein
MANWLSTVHFLLPIIRKTYERYAKLLTDILIRTTSPDSLHFTKFFKWNDLTIDYRYESRTGSLPS